MANPDNETRACPLDGHQCASWQCGEDGCEMTRVQPIADAICEASAAWIAEPLHRMAYEDMARAALSVIDAKGAGK